MASLEIKFNCDKKGVFSGFIFFWLGGLLGSVDLVCLKVAIYYNERLLAGTAVVLAVQVSSRYVVEAVTALLSVIYVSQENYPLFGRR